MHELRRHCAIDAMLGDLTSAESVESEHVVEAIRYRILDRTVFY